MNQYTEIWCSSHFFQWCWHCPQNLSHWVSRMVFSVQLDICHFIFLLYFSMLISPALLNLLLLLQSHQGSKPTPRKSIFSFFCSSRGMFVWFTAHYFVSLMNLCILKVIPSEEIGIYSFLHSSKWETRYCFLIFHIDFWEIIETVLIFTCSL